MAGVLINPRRSSDDRPPPSTQSGRSVLTKNNFDLIRLCAALQVTVFHTAVYMDVGSVWVHYLGYFPGVPIFFFISGFLIYQSYNNIRANKLKTFFTNRVLRLYPALCICIVLSAISVYASGYLTAVDPSRWEIFTWLASQLTFLQFYNPDFLRGYGTGKLNASLWTISIELQFYVLTPVIFLVSKKFRKTAFALFVLFAIINVGNSFFNPRVTTLQKILNVSFAPWIFMFATGAYLSTNKALQQKIVQIPIWATLPAYLVIYYFSLLFNFGTDNSLNPLLFLLLCCIVIKAAYTKPDLSDRLLRRNDISYGVYIYHMPIVNFLIYQGVTGSYLALAVALLSTMVMAMLSWVFVESPALLLKRITLHQRIPEAGPEAAMHPDLPALAMATTSG